MLAHFPIAQEDELLTSIFARFTQEMGIKDDKVALDLLFGNRMVVPSIFLQGHIAQLLKHVGHLWDIDQKEIVERHTYLPLFRSFLSPRRYNTLQADLIYSQANPSMLRTGISASVIHWPSNYKICPQCWLEQHKTLGFSYWQRFFQSPGVNACPKHQCVLIDTLLPVHSTHRHHFVGANHYQCTSHFSEVATSAELKLADMVKSLFDSKLAYVTPKQWTLYYQQLARDEGVVHGAKIDHKGMASVVQKFWTDEWLQQQGLALSGQNHWLLGLFRKHRRPFSYLQHFIVWLSLKGTSVSFYDEINCASSFPKAKRKAPSIIITQNILKRDETRIKWLNILKSSSTPSLKHIRSTKIGARLYLWLYRYDRAWLSNHKPPTVKNYQNNRVDWRKRDLQIVKQLIYIKNEVEEVLDGPRHSKSWFSLSIGQKSLIEKKLSKMPLCSLFFARYSETIEEYQIRRLTRIMVQLIEHKDILRPVCEIERLAGLSRERSRKPAREVLRLDIPAWQRLEAFS